MANAKDRDSEEFGDQEDTASSSSGGLSKYAVPAVVILLFMIAVLATNAVDTSISGAMIAAVSSDCQEKVSTLEAENADLKEVTSTEKQALLIEKNNLELENIRLKNMAEKLGDKVDLYSGIIGSIETEDLQTVTTPFGFKATWDKYVVAKPGQDTIWYAELENTGPSVRSLTLDLKMKSAYKDAFEKEPSVIGSLTLKSYNSGSLNVKLTPDNEGYAIFGIYVNGNYLGDLIVFAF